MSKREQALEWEAWMSDQRVRFSRSGSGIRIKVPGHDGWPRESSWRLLIGDDVDATVRRLLLEIGWHHS
jgi:hypothetical protein